MKIKFIIIGLLSFLLIISIFNVFSSSKSEILYDLNNSMDKEDFQTSDTLSTDLMTTEFNYVVEKILDVHPDPKRYLNQNGWDELIVATERQLAKPLQITEYFYVIQSFVSEIRDSHTFVYPSTIKSRVLPLELQWVGDELVVTDSSVENISHGDELTHIEGKEINEIMDSLTTIISSENDYWIKHLSRQFITQEKFLKEILTVEGNSLAVTVSDTEKTSKNINVHWVTPEEANQSSADEETWYGYELDQENNIGYYFLNESNVTAEYEQNVREFFKEVEEQQLENIIIDLRKNGGGDSGVSDVFIRHLPENTYKNFGTVTRFSEPASVQRGYEQVDGYEEHPPSVVQNRVLKPTFNGDVYILTGHGTYSSANMFAVLFHDSDLGTIIGEPTGNAPGSFGDILHFPLPYTGFDLLISHKEFLRPHSSMDNYTSLYPDILVEIKKEDIIKQEDGQLQRVKNIIKDLN
ncbi:S41 family peptidase [Salipaludibacillus sp. CUR1]|uniref:S41 family peptidase n=1 Tax=Salipaludibacillus sp. CUR1 TaxID=2820003 RepID=UPI001E603E1F|nr:S41 family peptidase [Salipaludibacillus sp. CUR1]MCE7792862.1 S41 family peptidase [Salipaludibacillus sp. CUR1]